MGLAGDYAGDVPVPTFGPRVVCTRCGMIEADARPDWTEPPAFIGHDEYRSARRPSGYGWKYPPSASPWDHFSLAQRAVRHPIRSA
jgi:hypothetical protein